MTPLDLTKHAPRSPYAQLDGLDMMPRTIDKLRALLPGGNPGAYKIAGSSKRLLDFLGVDEAELLQAVATAANEEDVAAWLRERVPAARYAQANERLTPRRIADVDDPAALRERYGVARDLPDDTPLYRMLELDDAQAFVSVR